MGSKNNYSYSKIDTYDQCHFKYKLKYVDGHYVFNGSVATEFGTLVHATEEAIAKAIQAGEPIDYVGLKNAFIVKMAEIEHKYPTDYHSPDKSDRTYKEKAYYYLTDAIYRLEAFMKANPTYEIVGIEKSFEVVYDESHTFKGFIDRVFRDNATGEIIVQDIKTYAVAVEEDKLKTPLQFVIYTYAAKELYGVDESQIRCQYYLPLCDLTQDAGTKGYMTSGKKKLEKLFKGMVDEDWTPAPTPLCHWCEFCLTNENSDPESRVMCPYFSHWTRENKDNGTEFDWLGIENHEAITEAYHKKLGLSE